MFITPFLRQLRKLYPDSKITLYSGKNKVSNEFFKRLEYIDEVIEVNANASFIEKILFIIKNFRKYDLFIDTFESTKIGGLFSYFLGKKSVGFSHSGYHSLNIDTSSIDYNMFVAKKEFYIFKKLGFDLDLDNIDLTLDFPILEKDIVSTKEKVKNLNFLNSDYVCIHPSSDIRFSSRKFEVEKWNKIIEYTINKGLKVVIIGTKSDSEIIDKIINNETVIKINNVNLTIWETSFIIKKSKLFIGINSGPAWISMANEIKTIVINGPSMLQWEVDNSVYDNVESVRGWYRDGDCYRKPCDVFECKYNRGEIGLCMKNIGAEIVIEKIEKLI